MLNLVRHFDFDKRGVIYYLGTECYKNKKFVNPYVLAEANSARDVIVVRLVLDTATLPVMCTSPPALGL